MANNTWIWVVLAVVVLGSFASGGVGPFFDKVTGAFGDDEAAPPASTPSAPVVGGQVVNPTCNPQPQIGVSAVDAYNGSTIGATIIAFDNDAKLSGSTPFSVSCGGKSTFYVYSSGHYKTELMVDNPAVGVVNKQATVLPNGTLTATMTTQTGSVAGTQAISANDNKIVKLNLLSAANRVFSNPQAPGYPVVCFNYNTTEINSITLLGATVAPQPTAAAGAYKSCYYAPFKSLANGQSSADVGGDLKVSIQSGGTEPACGTAPSGIVYDVDAYYNGKTQKMDWGVEDCSTGSCSAVGGADPTFTLACS